MKRILTLVLTAFILSGVTVSLLACGSDSGSTAVTEEQVVAVQRGDLTIDITAVGNLAFTHEEELTFGVEGTVGEVLVEVGDSVEEGQVLAELDDTSIISLQKAVVQARINLSNAGDNESDIIQAELDVVNAKIALMTTQEAYEKALSPYDESDITQAELAVINAEIALDNAEDDFERAEERYNRNWTVPEWILDYEQEQKELAIAEFDLADAEETLAEMEAGADSLEVEQKQKQLAVAQANLKEAEDDLAEIQAWIEGDDTDSQEVALKQSEVASTQAALNVDTAQTALDEAIENLEGTTMIAPFTGIVTSVNVEAGGVVNANQVAIELVNPDKFKAEILVSEIDILEIQEGATATIQVDAMGGVSLPAAVATISPIATIQSGVVNYKVTVELESMESLALEPLTQDEETESQEVPQSVDDALDKAVADGRISQEQADMIRQRFSQMGASLTPEQLEQMIERFGQGLGNFGQRPGGILLENLELREGLTVTVSVIVEERDDVLLVPNTAITTSGRQTYVKVVLPDGTSENRLVTTGISDWQYTEIVEGLDEGDSVVVPETTTTTTQQNQPGAIFGPGMGGFGR